MENGEYDAWAGDWKQLWFVLVGIGIRMEWWDDAPLELQNDFVYNVSNGADCGTSYLKQPILYTGIKSISFLLRIKSICYRSNILYCVWTHSILHFNAIMLLMGDSRGYDFTSKFNIFITLNVHIHLIEQRLTIYEWFWLWWTTVKWLPLNLSKPRK